MQMYVLIPVSSLEYASLGSDYIKTTIDGMSMYM